MTNLDELRADFEQAQAAWELLIAERFPGATQWHWYRAVAAVRGENVRRNDDTSRDAAMAADDAIRQAHDDYIRKLHVFYRARDGEHGVLGGRGL